MSDNKPHDPADQQTPLGASRRGLPPLAGRSIAELAQALLDALQGVLSPASAAATTPAIAVDEQHEDHAQEATEQAELQQRADPRIRAIAAEARERGWGLDWADTPHGVELLVNPTISADHPFGFGVGVRLGGEALKCWAYEGHGGTLTEPRFERQEDEPPFGEDGSFPIVQALEDCCRVFDRGAARYLSEMRRFVLEEPGWTDGSDPLVEWADIEPIAKRAA